jgi:hypothetical protein
MLIYGETRTRAKEPVRLIEADGLNGPKIATAGTASSSGDVRERADFRRPIT